MSFIQIIEFRPGDNLAEMQKVMDEWEQSTAGKRTAHRGFLCRDRNDPGRYVQVVFFPSYEEAMKNSNLPETAQFAERMMSLAEGPATFHDLDIIDERRLS
jgi:hypothetical protein